MLVVYVACRQAQVEARVVYGVYKLWRVYRLRWDMREQLQGRQDSRNVSNAHNASVLVQWMGKISRNEKFSL